MVTAASFDPTRFEAWLRALPGCDGARLRAVRVLEGGASNITCRVDITGLEAETVVLRLQRERGIFEPYNVVREAAVLQRLRARTAIPVPALHAVEPDPRWLGAPFVVLEWVPAPHMGMAGAEASYEAFVAMVAAIHALDWQMLGFAEELGEPASPAAALAAELAAIDARRRRFAPDDALLATALETLQATIPGDGTLALCQGDINVFNYLFRKGKVVAVVDWEQARISDPRSDVGQLLALSHLKGAPFAPAESMPFARAYGAARRSELTGMAWFRARWLWELGIIAYGWRAFTGGEPWYSRELLETLLGEALAELAADQPSAGS
jgi:aminoglycoside phosphotransferase (APT) family kinase protein